MTRLLLATFAVAALAGCTASDDKPADTNNARADAGPDATPGNNASDAGATGELQVGYHVAYESTPDGVVFLEDGMEVPLTFGVQGSWMVVLGFRTQDLFEGMLDVQGEMYVEDVEAGRLWLELQETFPGGDGWDYYYNFFLAIDHQPEQGTPARIVVRVIDEDGTTAERTHEVLVGPSEGGP